MAVVEEQYGDAPQRVVVGRVGGAHGVRGWVRVQSYTEPQTNIFDYYPWQLKLAADWQPVDVVQGRRQGKGLVAKLAGCDDRQAADRLRGAAIHIDRRQLPEPQGLEYYWADLLGVEVVNGSGVALGRIVGLLSTGANDVLRVHGDRERLIPFLLHDVVQKVDLSARIIRVDWDPNF